MAARALDAAVTNSFRGVGYSPSPRCCRRGKCWIKSKTSYRTCYHQVAGNDIIALEVAGEETADPIPPRGIYDATFRSWGPPVVPRQQRCRTDQAGLDGDARMDAVYGGDTTIVVDSQGRSETQPMAPTSLFGENLQADDLACTAPTARTTTTRPQSSNWRLDLQAQRRRSKQRSSWGEASSTLHRRPQTWTIGSLMPERTASSQITST